MSSREYRNLAHILVYHFHLSAKEVPVGFQNIRLQFTLDTDASEEQRATLMRLTERCCVVYQTLAQPPKLAVARKRTAV